MNIYVGNLSLETTEDDLREMFTEFGVVTSVTIMNDKYIGSGQPNGYGYVEMALKAEGVVAIANIAGKNLRNRTITAVEALPLSHRNELTEIDININNQIRIYNRRNKKRERDT